MPSVSRSFAAGVAAAAGLAVADHAADAGEALAVGCAVSLAGRGGVRAARLGGFGARAVEGTCAPVLGDDAEAAGAAALIAAPLADTAALELVVSGKPTSGLFTDNAAAGIADAAVAAATGLASAAVSTATAANAAALEFVLALGVDCDEAVGVAADETAGSAANWPVCGDEIAD